MASSITVVCPECEKQITVPAEAAGKKIRCKGCEHVFVVKAPPAKAAARGAPAKGEKAKDGAARSAPKKAVTTKPDPAAKAPPAKPAKPSDDDEDDDGAAYGVTSTELGARCPECANEMESEEATLCLHCGYNTRTRTRAKTKKLYDVTGLDVFLWLLPGILCVLGILALIAWDIIFCLNGKEWVGDAWYSFVASDAILMWMCIISAFFMYALGYFAVKRLILNNKVPEVERKE